MTRHQELRDAIDHLESLEGDGTELITITLPPDKSIRSLRERIAREHAGAKNIKDDRTRDRVQRALQRIQRLLRTYAQTPEQGLVVYAGVVDGELESYTFDDLPTPVIHSTYRCDDRFDVAPLVDSVAPSDTFGLIVVERGSAAIGRLVGERVVPIRTLDSQVMGKTRAGGQSAKRFERERERQAQAFFTVVGRIAGEAFDGEGEPVTGIAVGGTIATARRFVSDGSLDHRLQERVIGTFPVEHATERGLEELVDRAENHLLDAERRAVRAHLKEFFRRLREDTAVAYGDEDVRRAVSFGAVETALVASTIPRDRRQALETSVANQGGDVHVVPAESDRGGRFAEAFGGVGALLRFPVDG